MQRVLGGTLCGTAAGALVGLLLTAVNNLVLARRFGAAEGSYEFWAMFLARLLFVPSLAGYIIWGVSFWRKRSRGSARPPRLG
ncbi:MAG TPA: hypothetical protein VGP07_12575 [Polyangia bacterium]